MYRGGSETPGYVLLNTGGHANASGLGRTFQPGRDVHPVTEDVVVLCNERRHRAGQIAKCIDPGNAGGSCRAGE
jgi:hypothetical protein